MLRFSSNFAVRVSHSTEQAYCGGSTLRFPIAGSREGSAGRGLAPFTSSSLATGTEIPEGLIYSLLPANDTSRVCTPGSSFLPRGNSSTYRSRTIWVNSFR